MSRVYYNKLVRDNIKDTIEARGEQCEVRIITDTDEYEQELLKKVAEEARGLSTARSRDEFLSEYVDVQIVLEALIRHYGFSESEIHTAKEANVTKKGLYTKQHFLHWSSAGSYRSNETPQGTKA